MKHLNTQATKIMDKLTADITKIGDAKIFDAHGYTKKWDGGIMAVHVEKIDNIPSTGTGDLFSITHYYKQNGDMMRDPEMIFWHGRYINRDGEMIDTYYPVYFRQDPILEEESATFNNGEFAEYRPRMQTEHVQFANMWMRNIKEQQNL